MNLIKELLEMTSEDKSNVLIKINIEWDSTDKRFDSIDNEYLILVKCDSSEKAKELFDTLSKSYLNWKHMLGMECAARFEEISGDDLAMVESTIYSIKLSGNAACDISLKEEEFKKLVELD